MECSNGGETKPVGSFAGGECWHSMVCARCENGDPDKLESFARWIREHPDEGLGVHADAMEGAAEAIRELGEAQRYA
jgi:hypothetical protein